MFREALISVTRRLDKLPRCKIQLFPPLSACFPLMFMQMILLLIKIMTLPSNSMMGKSNSSNIYLPAVLLCAHASEEFYSRILEKSCWWPWKFKYAWVNSSACLLSVFFYITLIKLARGVWIQLPSYAHLPVQWTLSLRWFFPLPVTIKEAENAVKPPCCQILITHVVICGFKLSSASLRYSRGSIFLLISLLIITPLYIHTTLNPFPPRCHPPWLELHSRIFPSFF